MLRTHDLSERILVERIICGDERAFQEMFYRYKDTLFAYCYRFTKSETLAEEIVHDVLVKVWSERESLDPAQSISGYLHTIARCRCLNFLKKAAADRRLKANILRHVAWQHTRTEDEVIFADLKRATEQVIRRLPEQQQHVYRLSREQFLSRAEIAAQLNISPHTVRNHMMQALKLLRKHFSLHTDTTIAWLGCCLVHLL